MRTLSTGGPPQATQAQRCESSKTARVRAQLKVRFVKADNGISEVLRLAWFIEVLIGGALDVAHDLAV